ncbi:MAG: DUF1192 family protein [Sphingomonadaceae bacterium]
MDEDDHTGTIRQGRNGLFIKGDAASMLASEDLDPYSLDELDARIALLHAEIERVKQHRDSASAHRAAADALFGKKSP